MKVSFKGFNRQNIFLSLVYSASLIISIILVFRFAKQILALPNVDLIAWDQAARADEAVRLAKEAHNFQAGKFLWHVISLNWWPPLLPLILVPFILILGPQFPALVIPGFLAYPLAVTSLVFLYKNLYDKDGERHFLGLSVVFSLALTSPLLLGFSSWVMLEIYGILFTYLTLGFYFKARHYDHIFSYKVCALFIFLLWTLKYNYGLILFLILLFFEFGRNREPIRKFFSSKKTLSCLKKPVFFPAYLLGLLIILIVLARGIRLHLPGVKLSIGNIYNPLMYLYLYLFIIILFVLKKNWRGIQSHLKPGQRELLLWGALPTALFLALPDKIKAIIKNYEAGRRIKSGISFEPFLFYLKSIGTDYSLFFPIGILVILFFIIGLIRIKKSPRGLKFLFLFFLLGFVSLGGSFNLKENRYIANLVPSLWLITAWVIESFSMSWPKKIRTAIAGSIFIAALGLSLGTSISINSAKNYPGAKHDNVYRTILDPVIQMSQEAQDVLILGAEDLGFHPLLKWKLEAGHFKQKFFRVEIKDIKTSSCRDWLAKENSDLAVFFIAERSAKKALLEDCQKVLIRSGKYKRVRRDVFREPEPLRILFLTKQKISE